MATTEPSKDEDLLKFLTNQFIEDSEQTLNDEALTVAQILNTETEAVEENTAISVISLIDDLQVTGYHPSPGVSIVDIKEEPPDTMATSQETQDNDDDDDVIFVDKETTIKYLTGEISFAEYNAHLEQQTDIKEEVVEEGVDRPVTLVAEGPEVEIETSEQQPSTSQDSEKGPAKKVEERKVAKSRLPQHLKGLMGEANMRYARGNVEEAIKICLEIIRVAPSSADPFQTLSMIYEEKGDKDKWLQYSLISAHLSCSVEEWVRVADICLELDNVPQAVVCYKKAIQRDSGNIDLWWRRCELEEKVGDKKKAVQGYQTIMQLLPKESGEKYLQLARDVARNFHAWSNIDKAVAVMRHAFELHFKWVTAEDVNLLLELNLAQQNFKGCVAALVQHCGICLHYSNGFILASNDEGNIFDLPDDIGDPVSCQVLEEVPIDLRSKLGVCFIHLCYSLCINIVVDPILATCQEEVGDLHLDIAEAFMDKGLYHEAKHVLAALVKSTNYNLAAVWLRFGECLNAVGELQNAVKAYKKVVGLAPTHFGARVSLASIQQQLGKPEEALAALDTGTTTEDTAPRVDASLLLHKSSLLFSQKKLNDFVDCAKELLFSHIKKAANENCISVVVANSCTKSRIQHLKTILGEGFDANLLAAREMVNEGSVTLTDLWELYTRLCDVLLDQKKYEELETMSVLALMFPPFQHDSTLLAEAEFLSLTACLLNRNGKYAYHFVRDLCLENLESNTVWNIFNQAVSCTNDMRHNRFCLRLMMKHPEHYALGVLNGHNALISGTYKHALGEYVACLKKKPQDPLLSLLVGITFIHLACQKFTARRNTLIIQGCSFLNQYLELRGDCQEANYNLGRAMHQIGLYHAAIHYYNKVLSQPPCVQTSSQSNEIFDLSKEAAFNLSLIYQSSDSSDMARHMVQQYIVI